MTTETTEPQPPVFIGDRPRIRPIELQWPILYNGKEYRVVYLTRLTAGDVAKFQSELEALLKSEPNATMRFPLFRDEGGDVIPDAVMDALEDDDKFELDKAAVDFLPLRFRALVDDTAQDAGGNIGPTSGE